jgi:hypothetical protein
LPRLRGTELRALLPRGVQAYREKSEVFEPISSFKDTSPCAWSSPAMSALQAALRNSPRGGGSLAPATHSKNSRLSERVTAGHSCRSVSKSRLARFSAF